MVDEIAVTTGAAGPQFLDGFAYTEGLFGGGNFEGDSRAGYGFPPDQWYMDTGDWATHADADRAGAVFDPRSGRTVLLLKKTTAGAGAVETALVSEFLPVLPSRVYKLDYAVIFDVGNDSEVSVWVAIDEFDEDKNFLGRFLKREHAGSLAADTWREGKLFGTTLSTARWIKVRVYLRAIDWSGSTPAYTVGIDRALLFSSKPQFRCHLSADQAYNTGGPFWQTVIFDTEDEDRGGIYDPTTGLFTAREDGAYHFAAQVDLEGVSAGAGGGDAAIRLLRNGTTALSLGFHQAAPGTPNFVYMRNGDLVELAVGDTVEVQVWATGTTPLVKGGSVLTHFSGALVE